MARQWHGKMVLQAHFGNVRFIWLDMTKTQTGPNIQTGSGQETSEHEVLTRPHGNAISKDKGKYKEFSQSKLECKRCIGYCISSRGGVLIT